MTAAIVSLSPIAVANSSLGTVRLFARPGTSACISESYECKISSTVHISASFVFVNKLLYLSYSMEAKEWHPAMFSYVHS